MFSYIKIGKYCEVILLTAGFALNQNLQAKVSVNFGPSFILRHDIYGANAVSEVQPMSPEDRKVRQHLIYFLFYQLF